MGARKHIVRVMEHILNQTMAMVVIQCLLMEASTSNHMVLLIIQLWYMEVELLMAVILKLFQCMDIED